MFRTSMLNNPLRGRMKKMYQYGFHDFDTNRALLVKLKYNIGAAVIWAAKDPEVINEIINSN